MDMIYIGRTEEGVRVYPPHTHDFWEIMTYTEGTGYLYTPNQNYSFSPGSVLCKYGARHGADIPRKSYCKRNVVSAQRKQRTVNRVRSMAEKRHRLNYT